MIHGAISLEKKASNPEFSVNEIRMFVHEWVFLFFLSQPDNTESVICHEIFFLKSTIYYMGRGGRLWYLQHSYLNNNRKR